MTAHKIPGHCSHCDAPCFDIEQVQGEGDKYPGEPKRMGAPTGDAIRITFWLFDGAKCQMTFCGSCAQNLKPEMYVELWKKCARSWIREMNDTSAPWLFPQLKNGILCELGREKWSEIYA